MSSRTVFDHYAPLVEGHRSRPGQTRHLETLHHGTVCIVAGDGVSVATIGNPAIATPLRSTSKVFQLLPFLLDGLHHDLPQRRAVDPRGGRGAAPGLADLAVMMSSHSGEAMHLRHIEELLNHHGLAPSSLLCGTHPPIDRETMEQLVRDHQEPSALHCNCSGKHTNMLIVAKSRGWGLTDYLDIDHPLQQRIHRIVSALADMPGPLSHVIDGCSLPTFVLPVSRLARLFGYLANPDSAPPLEGCDTGSLLRLAFHAATTFPEMIAGTGRLDTEVMQVYGSRVFAKTGAAGVYVMAVRPDDRYPAGLAVAIKVADGDPSSSIRRVIALEILRQLKTTPDQPDEGRRQAIAGTTLTNFRGLDVGELRPVFDLGVG